MDERAIARFWAFVERKGDDECWEWTGAIQGGGYGGFDDQRAHRVSWSIVNGPIPRGLHVCHRCDNRRCVNPGHLFLGTRADNTADMIAKGRAKRSSLPRIAMVRLTVAEQQDVRLRVSNGERAASIHRNGYLHLPFSYVCQVVRDLRGPAKPQTKVPDEVCLDIRLRAARGERPIDIHRMSHPDVPYRYVHRIATGVRRREVQSTQCQKVNERQTIEFDN